MSDLASLIKSFESCGLSKAEAIAEAKAERERDCELFYCYFIVSFFDDRIV